VSRLTSEARDGLMRAWLELLRERHPCVSWVPVSDTMTYEDEPAPIEAPTRRMQLATV
jgi:hypothetical protein